MRWTELGTTQSVEGGPAARAIMLVIEKNEPVMESLQAFAREQAISAASFFGIGALRRATVGFFERENRTYREIPVNEHLEVLSFAGNITAADGSEPRVHAHVTLGRFDGSMVGGHLMEATTWPTLEVTITAWDASIASSIDDETGLLLLAP